MQKYLEEIRRIKRKISRRIENSTSRKVRPTDWENLVGHVHSHILNIGQLLKTAYEYTRFLNLRSTIVTMIPH